MDRHCNIKLLTHFVIVRPLEDGIRDIQFKHIADYIDAIKVLDDHKCVYVRFKANEGEYFHIFTNEQGLTTLSIYYG